jgi:hypothetical protein
MKKNDLPARNHTLISDMSAEKTEKAGFSGLSLKPGKILMSDRSPPLRKPEARHRALKSRRRAISDAEIKIMKKWIILPKLHAALSRVVSQGTKHQKRPS